jgi:hypothetical protein
MFKMLLVEMVISCDDYINLVWRVLMFNATFNNISGILWRSVWLVEETGVPGKNHRPATSPWQALSHNIISGTPLHELTTLVVISIDCIGSCESNYHTITTTTTLIWDGVCCYNDNRSHWSEHQEVLSLLDLYVI